MVLYDKSKVDDLLSAKLTDAPSDGTTYARKDAAWVALGGGVSNVTTDYTLVLSDAGKVLYVNGSSGYPGNGITVPDNASVAFPLGTKIDLCFNNGNTVYIYAGSGVTLYGTTVWGNQSKTTLTNVATDVWFIG
jgi:hypothetical protein